MQTPLTSKPVTDRDVFWAMAQARGEAAAKREIAAQKRRDRSPAHRDLLRLCEESRKVAGLS